MKISFRNIRQYTSIYVLRFNLLMLFSTRDENRIWFRIRVKLTPILIKTSTTIHLLIDRLSFNLFLLCGFLFCFVAIKKSSTFILRTIRVFEIYLRFGAKIFATLLCFIVVATWKKCQLTHKIVSLVDVFCARQASITTKFLFGFFSFAVYLDKNNFV